MLRILFMAAILTAAACAGETDPAPSTLTLEFQHQRTIGGGLDTAVASNGYTDSVQFEFPAFVRFDGASSVYVLDAGSRLVSVFDSLGQRRAVLGRRGRGPGELRTVSAMDVAPDGTVWVLDVGNGKAVAFRHDSVFAEVRIDFQPAGIAAIDSAEVWVAGDLRSSLFVRMSADGSRLGTAGVPADTSVAAFRSNQGVAAHGDGDCAVAWAYMYRSIVQCFSRDGALMWRTDGPVQVSWPSDADPFSMSENDVHAYTDINVVGDRVFALFKGGTGAPYARDVHVFSTDDGRFIGRHILPDTVAFFDRTEHQLATVSYDGEFDIPRLHLYSIVARD